MIDHFLIETMSHANYPLFFGPYGPDFFECPCGFEYVESKEFESADPELIKRLIILRGDHFVNNYSEYPYDHIRISYDKSLSVFENTVKFIRDWPQYQGMDAQMEPIIESYSLYAHDDDGSLEKTTEEIVADQMSRLD